MSKCVCTMSSKPGEIPSYSEAQLLSEIRQLSDGDTPPTKREFDNAVNTASETTVVNHFGSWNAAVEQAGFEPRQPGSPPTTRSDIIDQIIMLSDSDTAPSSREFDSHPDTVSRATVRYHFGGYNNAVREAGLEPHQENLTREDLIEQLQDISEDGSAPSIEVFHDHDDTASMQSIYTNFDGYSEAVEAAGLSRQSSYTDESVVEHLKRLGNGDSPPTQSVVNDCDDAPSVTHIKQRFGGWDEALSKAGFD